METALKYSDWKPTCDTLHMWLEMAGKLRVELGPHRNHYWEATFYVTPRGLTTSAMPLPHGGLIELHFDFHEHKLIAASSDNRWATLALSARPVAEFYAEFQAKLADLGAKPHFNTLPAEFPSPIRFEDDTTHRSYDPKAAAQWWRTLVDVERVLQQFRSRFIGKCSPVQLFFGSMDLAVTRFSGRRAPARPGADAVTRDAYSHEVSSVGYWPGSDDYPYAAFYAYAAPAPAGFADAPVGPVAAQYNPAMGEFLLKFNDVSRAADPDSALLEFCQSSYEAAARLAAWDRKALER